MINSELLFTEKEIFSKRFNKEFKVEVYESGDKMIISSNSLFAAFNEVRDDNKTQIKKRLETISFGDSKLPAYIACICTISDANGYYDETVGESVPQTRLSDIADNYPFKMTEKRAESAAIIRYFGLPNRTYSSDEITLDEIEVGKEGVKQILEGMNTDIPAATKENAFESAPIQTAVQTAMQETATPVVLPEPEIIPDEVVVEEKAVEEPKNEETAKAESTQKEMPSEASEVSTAATTSANSEVEELIGRKEDIPTENITAVENTDVDTVSKTDTQTESSAESSAPDQMSTQATTEVEQAKEQNNTEDTGLTEEELNLQITFGPGKSRPMTVREALKDDGFKVFVENIKSGRAVAPAGDEEKARILDVIKRAK